MQTDLYLRYVGIVSENDSEIPLSDLGKSLIHFEKIAQDFSRICQLEGDLKISAVPSREGSHIIDMILHFEPSLGQLPFSSPENLLEFLKLAGETVTHDVFDYALDAREFLNKYFAEKPFDIALFALVIPKLLKLIGRIKKKKQIPEDDLSKRLVKELKDLLEKNSLKGFISPIMEESTASIEVSPDRAFLANTAKIDQENFEDFLAEENQILPDFMDGDVKSLEGEITSLKGTRGDSFTFNTIIEGRSFNLELFPPLGKRTKEYVYFYQERVDVRCRVERTSMYKKPKLHLNTIDKIQGHLFLEDNLLDQASG
jgi:hypothetical protein